MPFPPRPSLSDQASHKPRVNSTAKPDNQLRLGTAANQGGFSSTRLTDLRVQNVVDFIECNYHRRLSLTEMAGMVNLSVWRLAHVFKNEVGLSPEHYLTLVRLTLAKEYLETGFRSVKEIAALVGRSVFKSAQRGKYYLDRATGEEYCAKETIR